MQYSEINDDTACSNNLPRSKALKDIGTVDLFYVHTQFFAIEQLHSTKSCGDEQQTKGNKKRPPKGQHQEGHACVDTCETNTSQQSIMLGCC